MVGASVETTLELWALAIIAGAADERLPAEAHASLIVLAAELQAMRTSAPRST